MGDMRNIVVVPYDPGWPEMYRQEAEQLIAVFGGLLLSIHHIGSTSIPDISAKPVIDIMPVVRHIEAVESLNPALERLGYAVRGENGIPGRRYFCKGGDLQRTHHVHSYAANHPEVARHLDFRDYLIAHPETKERYARLKIAAAKKYPHDIYGYMAAKDAFIQETIQKAQQWRLVQSGSL